MKRRFNRFELKYVIGINRANRIQDDLALRTQLDSHGRDGTYRLLSLYYDSPSRECFWAKVEGLKFRRKLRLRIYVPDDITSVSTGIVEIKQRINRTVQKRRLALALDDAEALCEGRLPSSNLDPVDRQVASEVAYLVRGMHFEPSAITAYRRQAFVGSQYDPGFARDLRHRCSLPHTCVEGESGRSKRADPSPRRLHHGGEGRRAHTGLDDFTAEPSWLQHAAREQVLLCACERHGASPPNGSVARGAIGDDDVQRYSVNREG